MGLGGGFPSPEPPFALGSLFPLPPIHNRWGLRFPPSVPLSCALPLMGVPGVGPRGEPPRGGRPKPPRALEKGGPPRDPPVTPRAPADHQPPWVGPLGGGGAWGGPNPLSLAFPKTAPRGETPPRKKKRAAERGKGKPFGAPPGPRRGPGGFRARFPKNPEKAGGNPPKARKPHAPPRKNPRPGAPVGATPAPCPRLGLFVKNFGETPGAPGAPKKVPAPHQGPGRKPPKIFPPVYPRKTGGGAPGRS